MGEQFVCICVITKYSKISLKEKKYLINTYYYYKILGKITIVQEENYITKIYFGESKEVNSNNRIKWKFNWICWWNWYETKTFKYRKRKCVINYSYIK